MKTIAKANQAKEPLLRKVIHNNLEEQIRQLTNELKIKKGQLKQGVDREKLGADREKQGADREKFAEEIFRQQTNELKIKKGQLKQGVDREKLGADREIDKDYLDLTKRFLPAGSINFKIIIGDGAEFVRKSKNKYDIIIQDVYERGVRIPGQFLGKKFIGAAYDALTDDGMLAINFAPDVIYLPVYLHKLRKSFGHVYRISHIRFANYIILCSKKLDKRQMLRLVESKMKMNEGNRSLLKAYRSMR